MSGPGCQLQDLIASRGIFSCGAQTLQLWCEGSLVSAVHSSSCSGILVLWPGMEPRSPALRGQFFNAGQPGKSHLCPCFTSQVLIPIQGPSLLTHWSVFTLLQRSAFGGKHSGLSLTSLFFPQSTEASLASLLVLEFTPPLSCQRALALAASTARDVLSQMPIWPTPSHTPGCSHVTLFMRPTLTTYLNGDLPPHLSWAPNSLSSPVPLFLSLHISDHFLTSCTSVILLVMIFLPQPECGSMTAELFVLFTDIPKNSKQCLAAHSRYSINIHWIKEYTLPKF